VLLVKTDEKQARCENLLFRACFVKQSPVIDKDTNLTIIGEHIEGMSDRDVTLLHFENSPIFPIHLRFIKKFPNLKRLKITRSTWNFSEPLENCENFIAIEFIDLDLAFVPKNFFAKCTKLNDLTLEKTKILSNTVDDLFVNQKLLEELTFKGEIIPNLRQNYFTSLVGLERLSFDSCEILSIDEHPFKSLTRLGFLYMADVKVDRFPRKLLDSLENLMFLILRGNSTSIQMDENFFQSLRTLKKLLSIKAKNIIPRLSENSFDEMTGLEMLDINENLISTLVNNTFGHLLKIFSMDLSENRIQKIEPDAFAGCETLTQLFLQKNEIEFVSGFEFQHLINLEKLDLQENAITKITKKPFEN
jgi:Leucine-rich repeat (LRR) protein